MFSLIEHPIPPTEMLACCSLGNSQGTLYRGDERGAAAGSCGDMTRLLDGLETTSRTILYGSTLDLHPGKELQSIISQLELLCAADEDATCNTPLGTRRKVEAQVQRLKMLKVLSS